MRLSGYGPYNQSNVKTKNSLIFVGNLALHEIVWHSEQGCDESVRLFVNATPSIVGGYKLSVPV